MLGAMFGGLPAGVSNVAASSDEIAYYFDPNSGDASVGYNGNSPWGVPLSELPAYNGYHLPATEGYIAYEDEYDAFAGETEYGFGYYINSQWPDEAHWNWDGSYVGDGAGLPPGVEWHAGTGDRNPSPMKVLVYAPWTGKSCVAVIGDSGPAPWTGRQFGVSNKVFDALDLPASYARADDTTFCRGNPNPGHAPSSDTNPEDWPVIKYEDNPYWVEFSWADQSLPPGPVTVPELEWSTTFGGSGYDRGFSVRETSDGGYIVAGFTESYGSGGQDVYLIKTDSSGNMTWSKTFGGTHDDHGRSVRETSDGGYIVAGFITIYYGGYDVYLVKADSDGNMRWSKSFGGFDLEIGKSVCQTSDGGYIVTGYTYSYGAGYTDVYLVKLTAETGGDTNPPSVSSVSPEDSAPDVNVGTVVTATFNEAMNSSTITTDSFTLAGSTVSGNVTYDSVIPVPPPSPLILTWNMTMSILPP